MHVAIITPCCVEDTGFLSECMNSVVAQAVLATHFVVCDGFKPPTELVAEFRDVRWIHLKSCSDDYGDTPRTVGTAVALSEGFDGVFYLDADNWFHRNHVQSIVDVHRATRATICAAQRMICGLDGAPLGRCLISGTPEFTDTNCLALFGSSIKYGLRWAGIPDEFHAIGDRIIWRTVRSCSANVGFSRLTTVGYRARHEAFYTRFGVPSPSGTKTASSIGHAVREYLRINGFDHSIKWKVQRWSDLPEYRRHEWNGLKKCV